MAEVTDRTAPAYVPTTNELDKIPDDLLSVPPAYFALGTTPQPMENPPEIGEVRTFVVRAVCTGEGKSVRTDGELRYLRKFAIQAAWLQGERPPTADDDDQPPLFGTDGEADPQALGDILEGVERPQFSNLTGSTDE